MTKETKNNINNFLLSTIGINYDELENLDLVSVEQIFDRYYTIKNANKP